MPTSSPDPRREVQILIWATGLLFVLVIALGAVAWIEAGNKRAELRAISKRASAEATRARREAAQTHLALCALRSDLERRAGAGERQVQRSLAFIESHPNGIPGISATLIRQGIRDQENQVAGQRSSIAVLSTLTCITTPSPEDARAERPLRH